MGRKKSIIQTSMSGGKLHVYPMRRNGYAQKPKNGKGENLGEKQVFLRVVEWVADSILHSESKAFT